MYVWSWQFMGIISLNEACSFRHGTGMCSRHSISVDKFINSSLRTWKSYLKIAPTKTRLLSWKKFEMRLPWQARSTNHAKLEPFTAVKEKLFQLWSQVSFFEISHSFRDLFFFCSEKTLFAIWIANMMHLGNFQNVGPCLSASKQHGDIVS